MAATTFYDPNNPLGLSQNGTFQNPYSGLFKPQVTANPNNPTQSNTPNIAQSDPLQNWGDLSSVIGAAGSGAKADRALQGQFTQNYDRLKLESQQDRRAQEADAMQKLASTGYIMGGGSKFAAPSFDIGGKTYHTDTYGLGPTVVTDAEKQGAEALQKQMLARVQPGGSYEPTDINSYAKPGTLEKITNIAAPVAGGIGFIDKLTGGKITNKLGGLVGKIPGLGGGAAGASSVLSDLSGAPALGAEGMVPGVDLGEAGVNGLASGGGLGSFIFGKALPVAGIGLGTYELLKNKNMKSDVMGGASAGAGVGTLIAPGIGTLAGAGIGAGVGALRHKFGGPDATEKEGRAAGGEVFDALAGQATPDQLAQARSAGGNQNETAAYLVMSDKLRAMGLNPALADQYMQQLHEAQKHGGKAVQAAVSPIDAMLSGRG